MPCPDGSTAHCLGTTPDQLPSNRAPSPRPRVDRPAWWRGYPDRWACETSETRGGGSFPGGMGGRSLPLILGAIAKRRNRLGGSTPDRKEEVPGRRPRPRKRPRLPDAIRGDVPAGVRPSRFGVASPGLCAASPKRATSGTHRPEAAWLRKSRRGEAAGWRRPCAWGHREAEIHRGRTVRQCLPTMQVPRPWGRQRNRCPQILERPVVTALAASGNRRSCFRLATWQRSGGGKSATSGATAHCRFGGKADGRLEWMAEKRLGLWRKVAQPQGVI